MLQIVAASCDVGSVIELMLGEKDARRDVIDDTTRAFTAFAGNFDAGIASD